jgi:hypothetical protein
VKTAEHSIQRCAQQIVSYLAEQGFIEQGRIDLIEQR